MIGGLGNQLFIYAMGRRLALRNNIPLKLDIISGFKNDCYRRKYLLKYFNIQANIAKPYESFETGFGFIRRRIQVKLAQLNMFGNRFYILEKERCFDRRLLNLKINRKVYLQGLWQSEHYFRDIKDIIRKDLEIIRPHDFETIKLAEKMVNLNAVSLHVRSYSEVPKEHGATTLSIDYYQKATKMIAQNISNPHFFCFSDNQVWLKEKMKFEYPVTFVSINTKDEDIEAIEEFWLMSQCKHHIIANSTFSWWGAWLNNNRDKMVIAPDGKWNNRDLIPETWITI